MVSKIFESLVVVLSVAMLVVSTIWDSYYYLEDITICSDKWTSYDYATKYGGQYPIYYYDFESNIDGKEFTGIYETGSSGYRAGDTTYAYIRIDKKYATFVDPTVIYQLCKFVGTIMLLLGCIAILV